MANTLYSYRRSIKSMKTLRLGHGKWSICCVQCSDTVDCLMPKWGPNRAPRTAEADFPFRSVNHSRRWGQQAGKLLILTLYTLLSMTRSHLEQPTRFGRSLRVECAIIALTAWIYVCPTYTRWEAAVRREMTMARCLRIMHAPLSIYIYMAIMFWWWPNTRIGNKAISWCLPIGQWKCCVCMWLAKNRSTKYDSGL